MSAGSAGQDHGLWLSRRSALALVGAGAAGLVIGSGTQRAQAHGTLYWHNEIWGQPTHYYSGSVNNSRTPDSFQYNSGLYTQCENWFAYYYSNTPGSWPRPGASTMSALSTRLTMPSAKISSAMNVTVARPSATSGRTGPPDEASGSVTPTRG